MRVIGALLGLACLSFAGRVPAGEIQVESVVSLRGIAVEGQPSWLEGGFGRLSEGAAAAGDSRLTSRGQADLGLDWRPTPAWQLHAHGVARAEPSHYGGQRAGLVEAFLLFRPELSPRVSLRVKAGLFFPQTSRENVERLWSSPYTITLSALNTWIGEEVRLTGVETAVVRRGTHSELQLAAGGFGVNDASGTLLGWRGWAMGDRLVTVGESLPLPPLKSLAPGGAFFGRQRADGTRPIAELDDRIGWNTRGRWQQGDAVLLQGAYLDNRGDRTLERGQYAWHTRFGQAGLELRLAKGLRLIAEAAQGKTGMGDVHQAHVDVDFEVGYAMLTWGNDKARLTARFDRFRCVDRDGTAEPNDDDGHAWTVAAFWLPRPQLRIGVEAVDLRAQRPAAAASGADPNTDARRAQLEVRLLF
jgi:hypothetical protein